jgi:hypothetical protein
MVRYPILPTLSSAITPSRDVGLRHSGLSPYYSIENSSSGGANQSFRKALSFVRGNSGYFRGLMRPIVRLLTWGADNELHFLGFPRVVWMVFRRL